MIRIGVIGAGRNGSGHARYYHGCGRSEVTAIADPDGERASALAREVGARAVPGYRDMLDAVDAVVISSPNHLHREHAVGCARAGKHLFCEKPMGLDAGQAAEIASAVREAGVASCIGFSVRFSPPIQTMQRYLREGRAGELISLWSRRMSCKRAGGAPGWRADHALSGGVLFEINVHEIDWIMALGGEVRSVYARTYADQPDPPRANDHVWATFGFAGGAVGTLEGSQVAPTPEYVRGLLGSEAGMITREWGKRLFFAERGETEREVEQDVSFDKRAHFLNCIEQGAEPVADAQWGLQVMNVAEAVLRSAASGEAVHLSEPQQC
jgi:predicted dehydrogenase